MHVPVPLGPTFKDLPAARCGFSGKWALPTSSMRRVSPCREKLPPGMSPRSTINNFRVSVVLQMAATLSLGQVAS